MTALFIPLRITPGVNGIYLKQLCGKVEMSVEDVSTKSAIDLIRELTVNISGENPENTFNAAKIVTADRDRILAQLYINLYGSKVESVLNCENCKKQFDLDFSLPELLNHYSIKPNLMLENGTYEIESGKSFRFPTGEDELMSAKYSPADAENFLLNKCLQEDYTEKEKVNIQQIMSDTAPVLNVEMQADCPECSHIQHIRFDIQSFFLMKLIQERPVLIQEIHCIASQYKWSQQEIMELPRNLRKQYTALIQSEN